MVEGRHHRSGRKLLMPGMFVGMGRSRQREGRVKREGREGAAERTDHLDHGPQRLA